MKKLHFLFSLVVVNVILVNGQQDWQWAKNPSGVAIYNNVTTSIKGDIIGTGSFSSASINWDGAGLYSSPTSHQNLFLVKYNRYGEVQWVTGAAADNATGTAVTSDANNHIFVLGTYHDSLSIPSLPTLQSTDSAPFNFFLAKFDDNGNGLWVKSSGIAQIASGISTPQALQVDSTGNVYIAGTFSVDSIRFSPYTLKNHGGGCFFVKYSPVGDVLWAKLITGSPQKPVSISVSPTGYIYLSGTFLPPYILFDTDSLHTYGTQDYFLVKYDRDGNVLKARNGIVESEATGVVNPWAITPGMDGGLTFAGGIYTGTVTFDSNTVLAQHSNQYLIHYDSAWHVKWVKTSNVCTGCFISFVDNDNLGNSFIAGTFYDSISFGSTVLRHSPKIPEIFLFKYNATGTEVWAQKVGLTDGESNYAGAYPGGLASDQNGSVYLAGSWLDSKLQVGAMVLTNPNPVNNKSTFIARYGDPASGIEAVAANSDDGVTTYPNPSVDGWQLTVDSKYIGNQLEIFNADGQKVFQSKIGDLKSKIDFISPASIYWLRISSPEVTIVRKLVKQ